MTALQDQAHFSIWCIMASPLIAGNDLRTMSAATIATLTNKHAIAVNQDVLGIQAHLVAQTDDYAMDHAEDGIIVHRPPKKTGPATQVWAKKLAPTASGKAAWAVLLLNRGSNATAIELSLSKLDAAAGAAASFKVIDLWADAKSLGVKHGTISTQVAATSCAFYRLEEQ